MCPLTVKILNAVNGTVAGPMALTLNKRTDDGGWTQVANGYQLTFTGSQHLNMVETVEKLQRFCCCCNRMTNVKGEIHNLITEEAFLPGVYRLDFDTKSYWKKEGSSPFHEVTNVSVNFQT